MTPRGVRFTASAKVWNSVIFSIDWRKDGRALIERETLLLGGGEVLASHSVNVEITPTKYTGGLMELRELGDRFYIRRSQIHLTSAIIYKSRH